MNILITSAGIRGYLVRYFKESIKGKGKIFAADIHPLAIKKVNQRALKKGLKNIETIQTDCKTKLEDESIDVIICFDVLHDIEDKNCIIKEFYRVLKRESILSFDDHHMSENEIEEHFHQEDYSI